MPKHCKNCAVDTVDPKKLLAWGDSQLKKIEKEGKWKKSNSIKDKSFSRVTNETEHVVTVSKSERKNKKVCNEDSGRKQKQNKSYKKTEMKETEDVIHICKNKNKKNKCESVCVNIELNKHDVSYEKTFPNSKRHKSRKKNDESSEDEIKKKKDYIPKSDKNRNKNEESYLMRIKVTKLDEIDKSTKENISKNIKLKHRKRKKADIYSNDSDIQDRTVVMGEENEVLSPKKRKKSKKHEVSSKESISELIDPNESISKKKKDVDHTEYKEKKMLSDVNEEENEFNIIKNISLSVEKKKRHYSENEIDPSTIIKTRKKRKHKEKTDVDTSIEVVHALGTDVSDYSETKKKKKMNEVSNEIYVKKMKKKKKNKDRENDDGNSTFSAGNLSSSYKTEKCTKSGKNFGKSPISLLLGNHELCNCCCETNFKCSRKVCNISGNSIEAETTSMQESSNKKVNDIQAETIENTSIIIKQEKIDAEIENCLPPNIVIKQEKIDDSEQNKSADSQFDKSPDVFNETTALIENVQVKQEVCDTSKHSSLIQEGNVESLSKIVIVNPESDKNGTENIDHNINNVFVSFDSSSGGRIGGDGVSNNNNNESRDNCNENQNNLEMNNLNENQNMQMCLDSNYESYYNIYDCKLTINEEMPVCNEILNHNDNLNQIKVEKSNTFVNNKEFLQEETWHNVYHKSDSSHPVQNSNTINNSREVSNKEIFHNCNLTNIEDSKINHNQSTNSESIEKNLGLDYIPFSNIEEHSKAINDANIRTVHEVNNKIQVIVNQHLNRSEHHQNFTQNECHNQQRNLRPCKNKRTLENQKNRESRQFNNHERSSFKKSLLFSCVRPQFRLKEQVSRLLKVDNSQIEFCFYRMNSKFYQDVHIRFFNEDHFQMVIRYYANRIRCKSWHIRDGNKEKIKNSEKRK